MEARWIQALDNQCESVVKPKPQGEADEEAFSTSFSQQSSSNLRVGKQRKRKRLVGSKNCSGSCKGKSMLKNYTRFMKSNLPKRVMFFQDNDWNDFPAYVIELVRVHFESKNPAIEVKFNGCHFLLDILRMIQWDVITGSQKHIAWIDEAGQRFFPEPDVAGTQESCGSKSEDNAGLCFKVANGMQEIKLELNIEINGRQLWNMEQGAEESTSDAKRIKIHGKPPCSRDDVNIGGNLEDSLVNKEEVVGRGQPANEVLESKAGPLYQLANSDTVRDMFVRGMGFLVHKDVIEINRCSSHLMQTRHDLFKKQVEITRNSRGDPNVKYAWLSANKDALSSIMIYGPCAGGFKTTCTYGSGVHLASVDNPQLSVNSCDDDENGVKHIVLCRVILGSLEVIQPGSKQFHPSNGNFDSGVDNLQNPHCYIVWNMNMDTHIFPEYVISFRMQTNIEGQETQKIFRNVLFETTVAQCPTDQTKLCHAPVDPSLEGKDAVCGSSAVKPPQTPWIPFPILLDAISKEVSANDMKTVNANYDMFRNKRITRDDFIRKLRMIVGDELLRSSILSNQSKPLPGSASNLKVPKPELG